MKDSSSFRKLLLIFTTALVLLWVNIWLSRERGGVYVGYFPLSKLWTADVIMIQVISLTVILSFMRPKVDLLKARLTMIKKLSVVKKVDSKNAVFCFVLVLVMLNGAYFSSRFMEKTWAYEDHGLTTINDALNSFESDGSLVFANNYNYMRTHISDRLFKQGSLLPLPDTDEGFLKLLQMAPNNTQFLISDDSATTGYDYSNNYIEGYAQSDIITPENPSISKFPKSSSTEPILTITFDDANEMTVPDHSGLENNGVNYGAEPVEGYYGKALRFDGKGYVSIPSNDILNVQNEITISFLAIIEKAEPRKGYMILSKGYAPENGSYNIFVYDGKLFFSLGEVGSVSVSAEPYVGGYHHFVFTYDSEKMEIYIDGSPLASNPAKGLVRVSSYDLEIGRDSQRVVGYHFVGSIDELQISNSALSKTELLNSYYTYYALRILKLSLPKGQAELFSVINNKDVDQSIAVKGSGVNVSENRTITLDVQIESLRSKNVIILVATAHFTKVYVISLDTGVNNVKFQFGYIIDPSLDQSDGFSRVYWSSLAQARLIIIENQAIAYNKFVITQDLKLMNFLLFALLLGIPAILFYCSYKERMYAHLARPRQNVKRTGEDQTKNITQTKKPSSNKYASNKSGFRHRRINDEIKTPNLSVRAKSDLNQVLSDVAGIFLATSGLLILASIGVLTWYDLTSWSKDIALIFFGPRTGEAISLGIGMRVIHYFLIGLSLFLIGIVTHFRSRSEYSHHCMHNG